MKTLLAPAALKDLRLLLAVDASGSGMLLGSVVGAVAVIERFFPAPPGDLAALAEAMSDREDELLGVYFLKRRPRLADWMIGRLVMTIADGQAALATCEWQGGRRHLQPLLEGDEA
jgi:hypothetical protein